MEPRWCRPWNSRMPTPKDNKEVTVVVQPPAATVEVAYELAYVGDTDGKIYEAVELDTPDADASVRELLVLEHGRVVLDVRVYLAVKVAVEPGQTATKTVVSKPEPSVDGTTRPLAPGPGAQRHVWSAEGLEVELLVEAVGELGPEVVEVTRVEPGAWSLTISRSATGTVVAEGRLVLPSNVVKR
jgi:hypothetical protein